MVKEVSYLWVLFRGKKDSRFQSLYILRRILLTGFMAYDSASSVYCFGARQSFRFWVNSFLKKRLVKSFCGQESIGIGAWFRRQLYRDIQYPFAGHSVSLPGLTAQWFIYAAQFSGDSEIVDYFESDLNSMHSLQHCICVMSADGKQVLNLCTTIGYSPG